MAAEVAPAERLAGLFYEGILAQDGWNEALRQVAAEMDSIQALIIVRDTATQRLHIAEHYNVPLDVTLEYNGHYHRLDPALGVVDRIAQGGWYHDRRDVGEAVMKGSEFYQDFMLRHGYASLIAYRALVEGPLESHLSLQRMEGQPAYRQDELDALLPLIPHLQRAIRIRTHMQGLAERAGVAERALDRLHVPLLAADDTGRVLFANDEALAFMRRKPELGVRGGRLRLHGSCEGKLERLVKSACGGAGPALAGGLRMGNGEDEWQVVVTPLPVQVGCLYPWPRPLALVLLRDRAQPPPAAESLLQAMYRLTPAEVRVTLAVVGGASPAQAAAQLGTSLATVRTQMKSVFLKTGTTRQPDLVRTVSALFVVAGRA